jgi:glycosyltransferase involved in cell wall biosynthesis
MKLTHLITSLKGGGTENFLDQLIRYSPENWTHQVLFLKKDGVTGDRLRQRGISPKKVTAIQLYQELRTQKPEALHTLLYRANQLGRVIGRVAGVKRIISSQRAIDSWQKPWHVYLDSFTLPFCDDVIVNSSAAESLVRARIKNHSKPRITRIFNGVDLERFSPQDRTAARQKLQLPIEGILGGSLMRLHAEKGADRILAFAQKALQENRALHLVVGGVGPLESQLREQSKKEPWAARWHWLGWVEDTPSFYAALDFFWSLSREESFPQSLLEASVMGVPWIAPNIGGIPDLMNAKVPGTFGTLYTAGNIVEAAALLPDIISKRQNLQTPPLAAFRQAFSVQEMAARFYHALT